MFPPSPMLLAMVLLIQHESSCSLGNYHEIMTLGVKVARPEMSLSTVQKWKFLVQIYAAGSLSPVFFGKVSNGCNTTKTTFISVTSTVSTVHSSSYLYIYRPCTEQGSINNLCQLTSIILCTVTLSPWVSHRQTCVFYSCLGMNAGWGVLSLVCELTV